MNFRRYRFDATVKAQVSDTATAVGEGQQLVNGIIDLNIP